MPYGIELEIRRFWIYNAGLVLLGTVYTHDEGYASILAERTWPGQVGSIVPAN